MTEYNSTIQKLFDQMPDRFRKLPISDKGFPVPKFVEWIDGKPDFRIIDGKWLARCITNRVCWLCGDPMGSFMAFVIGPMCAVNRINSEPPCHLQCAKFATMACPFMVNPRAKRNAADMPENRILPPGHMIDRNPGVMLIWVTRAYRAFKTDRGGDAWQPGGILFKLGDPTNLYWYANGRTATRDEILASIESGLPLLRDAAASEGPDAIRECEAQIERGMLLVPGA